MFNQFPEALLLADVEITGIRKCTSPFPGNNLKSLGLRKRYERHLLENEDLYEMEPYGIMVRF